MKIRKCYTLFVNGFTATAIFGGDKFSYRISNHADIGDVYYCSFSELKHHLRLLQSNGYHFYAMRH